MAARLAAAAEAVRGRLALFAPGAADMNYRRAIDVHQGCRELRFSIIERLLNQFKVDLILAGIIHG